MLYQIPAAPRKPNCDRSWKVLGAVIAPNEGGRLSYNGNWLEQARHLSPDTESGKLASFVWIDRLRSGCFCDQRRQRENGYKHAGHNHDCVDSPSLKRASMEHV